MLFSNPEVIFLKDSNSAEDYLAQLQELKKTVSSPTLDKEITVVKAGIAGENNIVFELKNSGMDLVVLHDLYMKAPNGNTAQIDFAVVTHYVTVFIECKNLIGNIEINNKGEFIRSFQVGNRKYREGIYSPITQNARHLEVFKECRLGSVKSTILRAGIKASFNDWNKSLVVLANPKSLLNDKYAKKEVKDKVIRADQLAKTLQSFKNHEKNSKKDMLAIGNMILSYNQNPENDRIEKIKEKISAEKEKDPDEMICPRCGGKLVVRHGKYGDFIGCSNYPHCRYTRKI